jgi:hypothetical protein
MAGTIKDQFLGKTGLLSRLSKQCIERSNSRRARGCPKNFSSGTGVTPRRKSANTAVTWDWIYYGLALCDQASGKIRYLAKATEPRKFWFSAGGPQPSFRRESCLRDHGDLRQQFTMQFVGSTFCCHVLQGIGVPNRCRLMCETRVAITSITAA